MLCGCFFFLIFFTLSIFPLLISLPKISFSCNKRGFRGASILEREDEQVVIRPSLAEDDPKREALLKKRATHRPPIHLLWRRRSTKGESRAGTQQSTWKRGSLLVKFQLTRWRPPLPYTSHQVPPPAPAKSWNYGRWFATSFWTKEGKLHTIAPPTA